MSDDREWEIWAEGYHIAPEDRGTHWLMGRARGETFRLACLSFFKNHEQYAKLFDATNLMWWSCKLFPTATEAAKEFG